MTEPDNFILRWARLKRVSESGREADVAANSSPADPTRAGLDGAEATAGQPPIDAAAEEPFDLASLPSIEAITANTDVRGFLQSRVPLELTRAALRQAWASDPAIRDFIGIAENQWDFNDPTAMPGFGPLLESDNATAALAQAIGRHDKLPDLKLAVSGEPALPAVTNPEAAGPGQDVPHALERSPSIDSPSDLPDRENEEGANNECAPEGDKSPRARRSHGSALPR
jgi:Protein of unknown function (DUF3306)